MNELEKEKPVELHVEKTGSVEDSFHENQQPSQAGAAKSKSDTPVTIYAEAAGNVINNTQQVHLPEQEKQAAANEAAAQLQQDKQESKKDAIEENDSSGVDG